MAGRKLIKLKTPLGRETVSGLMAGDVVSLDGEIFTLRDKAHKRVFDLLKSGKEIPFDLREQAIFHAGPIMRKTKQGWKVVVIGPTTSARLESFEPELIKRFKIRAVIGKGGMGKETADAMRETGCVYLAAVGGAAALLSQGIKKVAGVFWLNENGEAEAVWQLQVKDFGPLIVAIDAHGKNLFTENENSVKGKEQKQIVMLTRICL